MNILNKGKTIQDCEEVFERKLWELGIASDGYRPVVELLENGRKKRRTASAESWSPETGEIRIYFEPVDQMPKESLSDSDEVNPAKTELLCNFCKKHAEIKFEKDMGTHIMRFLSCGHIIKNEKNEAKFHKAVSLVPAASEPDQERAELMKSLEAAENTPGRMFVALKWFRDDYLPSAGLRWAQDTETRQSVLAKAIQDGWILTGKVPNPKSPFYPTTTIRLNRQKQPAGASQSRFRPVPISGEPLSRTILDDRGTR